MTTPLIILGAGGFGREIVEYVRDLQAAGSPYAFAGFLDDRADALRKAGSIDPILGTTHDAGSFPDAHFVIAVGEPATRALLAARLQQVEATLARIIHPTAQVSPSARIGDGTIICPFAFLSTDAVIGRNVAVNVFATIGHDAAVGDDSVISPYSAVLGNAHLEQRCFTGTHASITPGVRIGADSKVAAGSVATLDLPPGSLAAGNPARSRVMFASPPSARS